MAVRPTISIIGNFKFIIFIASPKEANCVCLRLNIAEVHLGHIFFIFS